MLYAHSGRYRPSSSFSARPQKKRRADRGHAGFRQNTTQIASHRYINQIATAISPIKQVVSQHQFTDFGLDQRIVANVLSHGYGAPTPIQDQIIPHFLAGKDVVGIANTGTGKTAAFLLPLLNKVLLDNKQGVLIVAPTRELAAQIRDELIKFAKDLPISMSLCVGGVGIQPQIRAVSRNPHFVIGTPGRIKDLVNRGALKTASYSNVVLDEVDRMLDIGFVHDIRFLIERLPAVRQSGFFSATMTDQVRPIMQSFLHEPVTVSVETVKTSTHIHQDIVRIVPGQNKAEVLHELLVQSEFERVIVFGRTKHGINKLERILAEKGHRVCAIHGNKSQNARQHALQQFKLGHTKTLLATDVAARGIDIDGVTHVINYDEPNCYEDYIHRIGRTGRAGKGGKALTFVG